GIHLTLAGRFRDSGFKNGLIDDFQVFAVRLTEPEVKLIGAPISDPARITARAQRAGPETGAPSTLDYFLARHHTPYRAALTELKKLREQDNNLINDVPKIMTMQELPQPRPA